MTLATIAREPEIIDHQPAGHVRVLALLNPFTLERVERRVPEGQTLGEIISGLGMPGWKSALVAIDGAPVPVEWWSRVRPRAGHLVTVRAIPRGGASSGEKGWIQVLAGVLLIIVGIVVGVLTSWTGVGLVVGIGLITTGVGLVIGGAITLIFPPPQLPKVKELASDQPVFAITGSRNVANPYGAVPVVLGKHRVFPCFGALPFTEIVGNDQYLRELFVVGYGPLILSNFKIGETPISQFKDVEIEVRQGYSTDTPMTLFSRDVAEDPLSIDLKNGARQVRRSREDADELSVDFVWPRGLVKFEETGERHTASAYITIEYRKVGTSTWTTLVTNHYSEASASPIRRGVRWKVSRGQYDVAITQLNGAEEDSAPANEPLFCAATWSALRTVTYRDPITMPGLAKVALRIKATDQLNGIVDQFNCIAQSVLPDWDANSGTWVTAATRNPAAIYRAIMQGPANARPVADSRLDLAALQAWHEECAAAGRTFDYVVEQQTTIAELLRMVTAVGRASMGSIDGTFGVVRDIPQTVPVQHFTPRNSRDFRGAKLFRDLPHALKCRFIDPNAGWEINEIIVYDDGFDVSNATKFETIQFFGMTSADQVYKAARYHIAAARLRPELYEFTTDFEHLVCTRGDLIRLTHDVPLFGIGSGRLKTVTTDGSGNATAVTVDEPMPMLEDGTRYSLRIRKADTSTLVEEIVPVAGSNTTLTFVTAIPAASIPAAGDLFMFGAYGQESVEAIVTRIEMQRDLGARITCVDAAPAIHQADVGAIPSYDPQITHPPDLSALNPLMPMVDAVLSDESVLVRAQDGSLESRILVLLHLRSATASPGDYIEARFRLSDSAGDWTQLRSPVGSDAAQVSITPVEDGQTYDIMLRGVSPSTGAASDWVTIARHTVIGKTTPPPDVATFLMEGQTRLRWSYAAPRDLAGFVLRRHRGTRMTWDNAQPMHEGLISSTTYDLGVADLGETTYLLKAVDVAGNESENPAVVIVNLGDPVTENIIFTEDKKAASFPGTHNGSIVGGNLVAASATLFWSMNDPKAFWTANTAATFWSTQYGALSYLTSILPDTDEVPCDILLDLTVAASAWSIQYRTAGDALFWSGVSGNTFWSATATDLMWTGGEQGFLPWPGRLVGASRQVYEFLVETAPGPTQGSISKYDVILDVPDVDEDLEDVVIQAASTRLPIVKSYRAIKTVALTVQSDGNGGVTARVLDKGTGGPPLTGGPDVEVLNASGTAVQGLVDAKIKGY